MLTFKIESDWVTVLYCREAIASLPCETVVGTCREEMERIPFCELHEHLGVLVDDKPAGISIWDIVEVYLSAADILNPEVSQFAQRCFFPVKE